MSVALLPSVKPPLLPAIEKRGEIDKHMSAMPKTTHKWITSKPYHEVYD